jgi:hypothetical protein
MSAQPDNQDGYRTTNRRVVYTAYELDTLDKRDDSHSGGQNRIVRIGWSHHASQTTHKNELRNYLWNFPFNVFILQLTVGQCNYE